MNTNDDAVTRSLSRSLAEIVAELELEQAFLVSMDDLGRLAKAAGVSSEAKQLAMRLRKRGWLLPTETAGVWEFAPGAHAGPIGHGHPFRELNAALVAKPDLDAAVCLNSALWAHTLLERAPERPEVAVPMGITVPSGLKRACRVVRFDRRLPTVRLRDTPVHRLETVLVHLAVRPSDVSSWGAVLEVLPELVLDVERELLERELTGRPATVSTRLAYLVQGVAPVLAGELFRPGHGKVWFGPRGQLKRHDARFDLADTILPISPKHLAPEGSRP